VARTAAVAVRVPYLDVPRKLAVVGIAGGAHIRFFAMCAMCRKEKERSAGPAVLTSHLEMQW